LILGAGKNAGKKERAMSKKRIWTSYPGVYYREGKKRRDGKTEQVFYVVYRKDGRQIEDKVGMRYRHGMTPAQAATLREQREDGKILSNRERRAAARAAREAEAGRWTIARLWQAYREVKGNEYAAERADRANFAHLGNLVDKEPKDLLPLDVDRIRIGLLKTHSPQTVAHVIGLLRRLIRFGERKGLCQGARFEFEKPRVQNTLTDDLSLDQIKVLLEALNNDPDVLGAAGMKLALLTGMRKSEVLKLEWRDIDFASGFLLVRDPKGKVPQRIPLEAARELLEGIPRVEGSPLVFPDEKGARRSGTYGLVDRLRKSGALPKGHRPWHSLRHSFASVLASSGKVDLYTIQRLLTHKTPQMTARYAHLADSALRNGSKVAAELLAPEKNSLRVVK
jgi:integrase